MRISSGETKRLKGGGGSKLKKLGMANCEIKGKGARAVVAIARKCKSGGPDRPLLASIIHHTIRRKSARFLGSHTILNAAAAKA